MTIEFIDIGSGQREVRIEHQSGALRDDVFRSSQCHAAIRRTTILPHNCTVHRHTGGFVPHHHRFALIGDTDAFRRHSGGGQRFACGVQRGLQQIARFMLHPARLWKVLTKLAIPAAQHATISRNHQRR